MPVQLNEEFNHPLGQFTNYAPYDPGVREDVIAQKHIDIRSAITDDRAVALNVLELSQFEVGSMTGAPVDSFGQPTSVTKRGEHWSLGATSSSPSHNQRPVLTAPLMTGVNTIQSVIAIPDTTVGASRRNKIRNPSFEVDTGSWTTFTANGAPAIANFARTTAWADQGGAAALLETGTHTDLTHQSGIVSSDFMPVNPTLEHGLRCRVRRISVPAGTDVVLKIDWYDSSSVFISSSSIAYVGGTNLVLGATPPGTAAFAKIKIYVTDYTGGSASINIDSVLFGEWDFSSGSLQYFDGYTPGYFWTGTPHNSPSEGPVPFTTEAADLLTGFEDDDSISLVLPDFPDAQIDKAASLMSFTSNPDGDFLAGPTATVAFNQNLESFVAGNSQFRVLRSTMQQNGINLGAVTGVQFEITSTADSVPFKIGALRLLAKDWKYAPLDTNTRYGELRRAWPRNGDPATPTEFSMPILWRSADVPGQADPKPIDFNLAVGFNTGSRIGTNSISMYGRELTEDFLQQLDINGLGMSELDGRDQPDLGIAMYNPRLQTDLEPFKQDQLKGLEQYDLERTPDYLSASWIQFLVNWTATTTQVSVVNTEGNGYNFNLGMPLAVNTSYVLVFELEDTAARAAIYPLGDRGQIIFNAPVFDSTLIDDDFAYKRRKGRFGWFADLEDGDSYIESIRFRSASYAEYRSLPYESVTPVVGAELIAESSPVIDLFDHFVPTESSIKVESDREANVSGESFRVTDYGDFTYQGIQSNEFDITDFDQTEILLDVYYPSSLDSDATLEFYLQNQDDYLIALPRPKIYADQWQTIRLRTPSSHLAQTGLYRLVIVQSKPVNLNWWVDNVRIFERTVSWHGRAYVEDPWAATEDDWTPFQNAFNRDYGGILFQGRGSRLQVKGIGHKQDAAVGKIQFKPRYAELGRFAWPEDGLTGLVSPVASYSTSNIGRTYTFDGFGSTDADGQVINWYWTVSDGSVYIGPIIQHTFGQAGTYTVALTVTDSNGNTHSTSAIHSVA